MKEIKVFKNFSIKDIVGVKLDISIYACGYEARCTNLFNFEIVSDYNLCFAFKDTNDKTFIKNLNTFKANNIEVVTLGPKSFDKILKTLRKYLNEIEDLNEQDNVLKVLIDYSSMTRYWYGAIINFLKYYSSSPVELYLFYSEAVYIEPTKFNEEIEVESIDFLSHISYPEKPVALIVGLGDHSIQAAGLKEYYDAQEVYYFYLENENAPYILNINKNLIENNEKLFSYKNEDLVLTKYLLDKLCTRLSKNYRIIIAPCGPKPFTLMSVLAASFSPNIDVWRIGFKNQQKYKRLAEPNGKVVGNLVVLN